MGLFDFFKKANGEDSRCNEPGLLSVKLFFKKEPVVLNSRIEEELKKRFSDVKFPDNNDMLSKSRHYFFNDYTVKYAEGEIAVQGTILVPDRHGIEYDQLLPTFQQSWHWKDAENTVRNCHYEVLLTDMMSRGLKHKKRIEFFQKFVVGVTEALSPQAIYFSSSDKIVPPEEYLAYTREEGFGHLMGLMNTRFYNIENSDEEMFMDTLGLHHLGLPDFQTRFSNYDPGRVAGILNSYSHYIVEEGVVIGNGNTIEGINDEKWKCYFEESSIAPKRIVIDIEK